MGERCLYLGGVLMERIVTYHRAPTQWEIRFGYGATHYLDVPMSMVMKPDGRLKRWFRSSTDGLRYYR